jgi:nitroreductase
VFDLYLVGLFQPRIFLELKFLSLAQAAESLHARSFDSKVLPKADHRANVRAVADAAPAELREWARVRLQDANRKSFRDALAELIAALPAVIADALANVAAFAERIRVTRNYLTHWTESLEAEAARGAELFALTRLLRAILEALLLLELGFSKDEVEKLLQRNEDYKRQFNGALATLKEADAERQSSASR